MRTGILIGLPLLAAILGACSGGGQVAGGGTGGTGISMGTVTGFGSVFVNGIEYQTNSATIITVDGEKIEEAEHKQKLDLGMLVKVDATRNRSGVWTADSIEYRSDLIGPAEVVDSVGGTIVMLGKKVTVKSNTIFAGWSVDDDPVDGSPIAPAIAHVLDNAMVKVTGFPDFNGDITATRIEWDGTTMWDPSMDVEMRGKVSAVTSATEFNFDGLEGMKVNHDGTTVLYAGDYARVVGSYDGTAITAKGLELEDRTFGQYEDEFEIEGLIQDIDALGLRIMVLGYEIDIASVTNPPELAVGDLVEVEGEEFDRGVLIADEIEIKHLSDMELRAKVQSHDAAASTVTMLGRAFHVTESTVIKNKADFFASLHDGVTVLQVEAYRDATGNYIVTEAEFESSSTAKIEGRVESADVGSGIVVISGIPVNVSGAAVPGGSVSGLVGKEVEIRGVENGNGGIDATRVDLDD